MNNQNTNKVYIYTLSCPITNQIKYVGKSSNPKNRFCSHINESKLKRTHKECWIFGLIKKQQKPILEILDEVEISEWEFWERHYICLIKSWGFNLVNGTDGGEGMSPEYMKNNNPMHNPQIAAKLKGSGNGMYGKTLSKETKELLSKANKGKPGWNKGNKEYYSEEMKIKYLYKPIKCHQNNKIYNSIINAAKDLGLHKSAVGAVARGKRKHHKGYTFEFVF